MTAEFHCNECKLANFIRSGEGYRHRYGMIAVNFGQEFIQRVCSTKNEASLDLNSVCDKPDEFVAQKTNIG